jgi:hypothetical protein
MWWRRLDVSKEEDEKTNRDEANKRKVWTSWSQSVEVEARRLIVQRCTGCAAGGGTRRREKQGKKKSVVEKDHRGGEGRV